MGIYKNDYKKEEDETLWEIHEIRHAIHKEFEKKTTEQINKESLTKYLKWKEQAKKENSSKGSQNLRMSS
jgi:hypothetical protein